jgi:hypothetical protein
LFASPLTQNCPSSRLIFQFLMAHTHPAIGRLWASLQHPRCCRGCYRCHHCGIWHDVLWNAPSAVQTGILEINFWLGVFGGCC